MQMQPHMVLLLRHKLHCKRENTQKSEKEE